MKFALLIAVYSGFTAYGLMELFAYLGMQGMAAGAVMMLCVLLLALLACACRYEA